MLESRQGFFTYCPRIFSISAPVILILEVCLSRKIKSGKVVNRSIQGIMEWCRKSRYWCQTWILIAFLRIGITLSSLHADSLNILQYVCVFRLHMRVKKGGRPSNNAPLWLEKECVSWPPSRMQWFVPLLMLRIFILCTVRKGPPVWNKRVEIYKIRRKKNFDLSRTKETTQSQVVNRAGSPLSLSLKIRWCMVQYMKYSSSKRPVFPSSFFLFK